MFEQADMISPSMEMGAYEYLWAERTGSLNTLSKYLAYENKARPSKLVSPDLAVQLFQKALDILKQKGVNRFGTRVAGTIDYPDFLKDDPHPTPFLYFQGYWDLVFSERRVAVVGTRKPSSDGVKRAEKLVKWLLSKDVTVVSGLAEGIDTVAHRTTIENGGNTIAVIGTPISEYYPKQNMELQKTIAREHLLISHVPIVKHTMSGNPKYNRLFFPERNRVMSAISNASIIVEAGETSGTQTQAKAALEQGRKLLILDNVFQRGLSWPEKYLALGAIRIKDINMLEEVLFEPTELSVD